MASQNAGSVPLDVVIVYAFDSTTSSPAWKKVDGEVFWLVQEKLTRFAGSCLGYIYVMSTPNNYTCDMKVVDPAETEATGYKGSSLWRRIPCVKNMASGLHEAQKLITDRGHSSNGIILFFSDGLINQGDFFGGVENFVSRFPVYTFTVGGDAYNNGLRAIAANSPGGTFNPLPVPDKVKQSAPFSQLLDSILAGTVKVETPNSFAGSVPLDVVIVYAFDSTISSPAWKKVDGEVFWLVQEKLTRFAGSCLGYIYVMSTPNNYTCDMKVVDPAETEATGYKGSSLWRRIPCVKNMASGLYEAQKLITDRGHYSNGIILFFSDGFINQGDFFGGVENFVSKFPVHTFTVGGDAYNNGLRSIAANSPGGTFNLLPVPDNAKQSAHFSQLLDSILAGSVKSLATPKKLGPWGGYFSGTPKDITEIPKRLESITIYNESNLHSIEFSYIDQTGRSRSSGIWGSTGMTKSTINLSTSEVLLEVSGTYTSDVLSSLKFVTNVATYGPYGTISGIPFKAPVPAGSIVVGFFAIAGPYLGQIGVYIMENARL